MREIKFRGLGYDNKWHYGFYYVIGDLHYIETAIESVSVNPLSINQFTGLHDKAGKDIYECDIVKDYACDYEYDTFTVYFAEGAFYPLVYVEEGYNCIDIYSPKRFEIIGNKYEYPELLK